MRTTRGASTKPCPAGRGPARTAANSLAATWWSRRTSSRQKRRHERGQLVSGSPTASRTRGSRAAPAPNSASAVGSRDVKTQPDHGDCRRKLIPGGRFCGVLARPGDQGTAPGFLGHRPGISPVRRPPGVRHCPYQPADQIGGRLARSSAARPARTGRKPLADLDVIEQLHKDELIGQYDAAVIDQENGKPTWSTDGPPAHPCHP